MDFHFPFTVTVTAVWSRQCGIFGCQELQGPLLRCLDGRTDLLNAPQVEQQMALVREESKVVLSCIVVVLTCSGYFSQEAPSKYGSNVSQQVQAKAPDQREM